MSSLRATDVAFAFTDAAPLFQESRFHLTPGWTGLVGANGAGKSTLLRLFTRDLRPTMGDLRIEPADARVLLCEQSVEVRSPEVELLAEGTDSAAHKLFGQLSLEPWELYRWDSLSPGERKRWQIAAALWTEPDVLLLDEPTNHLDVEGREWLLRALERFRGVGVVVSHDRALLDQLTTHTLRIHRSGIRLWAGPYTSAKAQWELEAQTSRDEREKAKNAHARAQHHLQQTRVAQQGADLQRSAGRRMKDKNDSDERTLGRDFAVSQAEKRLGRQVEVARRAAERAEAALANHVTEKEVGRSLFLQYERAPKPVLLQVDTDELRAGDKVIAKDVHLTIGREDRVQLSGANGAGKSTLLKALVDGSRIPAERLLYLPQEIPSGEAIQELERVRSLPPEEKGRVLSLVAALGVDPDRLLASEQPSPGEARKLLLASGLGRHAWALVLDEPTNHLDLPAIERLEAALTAFPGAIVLVTHDSALAAQLVQRTLRLPDDLSSQP